MTPLGRLEVICGPMFSGKTTALIAALGQGGSGPGGGAVAIKPARDTRYAASELVSHAGARLRAVAVEDASQVVGAAGGVWGGAVGVVGIDEAHFFGAALVAPVMELVGAGRRVIVAGLERDHRGEPFEPFTRLLIEADVVMKLSTPCAVCGRPAVHSQRMTASGERIVVGGAGDYEARCRGCFEGGR